jgi:hypothetical protein
LLQRGSCAGLRWDAHPQGADRVHERGPFISEADLEAELADAGISAHASEAIVEGNRVLGPVLSLRSSVGLVGISAHGLGARPRTVDRVIYGTITLMSVLIVYDGWQQLRFIDVVWVIVGPVLAMFLSHVFAANLAAQVALGRSPTGHERIVMARSESRFLLLAGPPLLLLAGTNLIGFSLTESIRTILFVGAASLGFWGGVAGRRAGLKGWPFVRTVLAGLVLGGLILALQVFLQPGKAVSGGTAMGVVGRHLLV